MEQPNIDNLNIEDYIPKLEFDIENIVNEEEDLSLCLV